MGDRLSYDVVVVGGGPAGATAALYTTRLGHATALFEKEGGRHAAVNHVHNVYGVSEDVSGQELSSHAVAQIEAYGADYYVDPVDEISQRDRETGTDEETDSENRFIVEADHATVEAERVVLATGFTDAEPSVAGLRKFTGRGLHYCLHCDGYVLGDASAYVLGHTDRAAHVAMVLLNFTADVDLLLDGCEPEWGDDIERQLQTHPVDRVDTEVTRAFADDDDTDEPQLGGLEFADGSEREYHGGFAVYGKSYNTGLAEALGCALADDGAVDVDDSFETSVDGVYAVGDLTHGQNQTVVAAADGAKAGMAIDRELRRYPRPPGEDVDESAVPDAPADLRSRMRLMRERDAHPGLGERDPEK